MIELYEYGIQTEDSTHRIHVDEIGKKLFVYRTECGVSALPEPITIITDADWESGNYYVVRPHWNNRVPTARGIRIRWDEINGCKAIDIPAGFIQDNECLSTTQKGKKGVIIAAKMLQEGLIPIQFDTIEIHDIKEQITGVDLHADQLLIQIKYDRNSFERGLFMQTHERNPQKMY